jgi:hypothetical protein
MYRDLSASTGWRLQYESLQAPELAELCSELQRSVSIAVDEVHYRTPLLSGEVGPYPLQQESQTVGESVLHALVQRCSIEIFAVAGGEIHASLEQDAKTVEKEMLLRGWNIRCE